MREIDVIEIFGEPEHGNEKGEVVRWGFGLYDHDKGKVMESELFRNFADAYNAAFKIAREIA